MVAGWLSCWWGSRPRLQHRQNAIGVKCLSSSSIEKVIDSFTLSLYQLGHHETICKRTEQEL